MSELVYEVVKDERSSLGDLWRAEAFGEDGECYVAVFAGPKAEQRAREYAALRAIAGQLAEALASTSKWLSNENIRAALAAWKEYSRES